MPPTTMSMTMTMATMDTSYLFCTTRGNPSLPIPSTSLPRRLTIFPTPKSRKRALPLPPPVTLLPISSHLQSSPARYDISSSRRDILGFIATFSLACKFLEDAPPAYAASSACDFTVAPSGLAFCDILPGSGSPASKGMIIKANYVGKLEDGKIFDSSYDRGKPFTFKVGVGQVIKGWDEGILGAEGIPPMLAGGKRTLRIPPTLGYGERGAGCRGGSCLIPPNSVLLFDVEFIGKAY